MDRKESVRVHHQDKRQKTLEIHYKPTFVVEMAADDDFSPILQIVTLLYIVILPWTLLLFMMFILAFAWPSIVLIFILSVKLKCTNFDIRKSSRLRVFIATTTVLIPYLMVQINVLCCSGGHGLAFLESLSLLNKDEHLTCSDPSYIIISGILCFFLLALFIKVNPVLKILIMLTIATGHILVMELTHKSLFVSFDKTIHAYVPTHVYGILAFILFLLGFSMQNREQESTLRLDYLWKSQAAEEKSGMQELQRQNSRILCNLLPEHVANHFLNLQTNSHMELYSQHYNTVGVFFASIPNFSDFYVELAANNQGVECLRVLNEIIVDFDELLDMPYFYGVEKIKTMGSCYMAATGLKPSHLIKDREDSVTFYMTMVMDFVLAMKEKLKNINENSYNNFELRVGINVGSVVAGVIGARKPQYDIWGNTVNVASRMESTGVPGKIQVTEDVYTVLKNVFTFECRGKVQVKGKGDMITYFVRDRIMPRDPNCIYPPVTPPSTPHTGTPHCRSFEGFPTVITNTTVDSPEDPSVPKIVENSTNMKHHLNSSSNEIFNLYASTMERRKSANTLTPTGSLNKRRRSSIDSPSLSRNPLKKFSISSSNHGASSDHVQKSNSPELPAVHFFNSKMQNQLRPASIGVQNSMFDSLKFRGSMLSPVSPISPKSTVSEGARGVKTMTSPAASPSHLDVVHSLRKVHSEPNCKPPGIPLTNGSPLYSRPLPPIYHSISPPKAQLKKVSEDRILEDSVILNTRDFASLVKNFPPKNIWPVGNSVNGIVDENHYTHLCECTTKPHPPAISVMSASISEDKFVTGIYREPIDKSPLVTQPARGSDTSIHSGRSNTSSETITHDGIPEKSLHVTRTSTKAVINIKRQSSFGSKESNSTSSASTVTPTGELVASIDGKTMSLHTNTNEDAPEVYNCGSHADGIAILRSVLSENKQGNILRNGISHVPGGIPRNVKEFRKSYPAVPRSKPLYCSPPRQRKETLNLSFISDDDKDSVSSRPHSNHSSIVFLSPVELKPSRNALIRQLHPQEGKQNVINYVFTSPCSTLEWFRSRSSDTINSISQFPPTPVPEPSTSLTQLLQELTAESDPTDIDKYYDEHQRLVSQDEYGQNFKQKSPESKGKSKISKHQRIDDHCTGKKLSTAMGEQSSIQQRISINPFQIKRRQLHSIPPRHCKSLDYIPSDREDNATSSSTSSATGSPKTRHAYLMPLIFGTQTAASRTDQTSLSSLASSSEMSQSDPQNNEDSCSGVCESEYDNYPPGVLSDEDFFIPESASDVDMDIFDDINVDNVTVSDNFSLDMPVPRFHMKTTDI